MRIAICVGINYVGTPYELRGCHADVMKMEEFLIANDFEVRTLLDDQSSASLPTKQRILKQLGAMAEFALPGDVLFVHFSGHGTSVLDQDNDERDGLDEGIVVLDEAGPGLKLITDDELFANFVKKLLPGVSAFCLMDCCHSGTIFDLRYRLCCDDVMEGESATCVENAEAAEGPETADVLAVSGCRDAQTSADAYLDEESEFGTPFGGAMTFAFLEAMRAVQSNILAASGLVESMRAVLKDRGFAQSPQLTTSKAGLAEDVGAFETIFPACPAPFAEADTSDEEAG